MSRRQYCNGKGNRAGVSGWRLCPSCSTEKPVSEFRLQPSGRPESYCRTCKNAHHEDRRKLEREAPTNAQELARLRKRIAPTVHEWATVQRAATAIADYLRAKANGEQQYHGVTGWAVLEELGAEDRRFHQLVSLAVVQQKVWEDERVGNLTTKGIKVAPEVVEKVRTMRAEKAALSRIAARLGIPKSTVSDILRGLTDAPAHEQRDEHSDKTRAA